MLPLLEYYLIILLQLSSKVSDVINRLYLIDIKFPLGSIEINDKSSLFNQQLLVTTDNTWHC